MDRLSKVPASIAILGAGCIIGLAIIGGRLISPYEISSGPEIAWRVNTVTGDVSICMVAAGNGRPIANCGY